MFRRSIFYQGCDYEDQPQVSWHAFPSHLEPRFFNLVSILSIIMVSWGMTLEKKQVKRANNVELYFAEKLFRNEVNFGRTSHVLRGLFALRDAPRLFCGASQSRWKNVEGIGFSYPTKNYTTSKRQSVVSVRTRDEITFEKCTVTAAVQPVS